MRMRYCESSVRSMASVYWIRSLVPIVKKSISRASSEAVNAADLTQRFPRNADAIVRSAIRHFAGTPYQWGGITPWGADCSGLVQTIFGLHGVGLPRDSSQQAAVGSPVDLSPEQLKRMQDELEKNAMTLSETQRRAKEREFGELNRDFQRKQREFREDLNQRRNQELASVVEAANRVIRQIAEQEKFDIIFQEMPAYVSPRIDITDRVIKALEGKSPAK